jgi:hypothetical protein
MTPSAAATHSSGLHPRIEELIEYLAEHRRGLHEAVASVPPSAREHKPAPDRWSVAEVIEHLLFVERRVTAILTRQANAARANGVGPDPETSSVVASYAHPAVVVDRTTRIPAPPLVQPTGTLDATAGTEALDQARADLMSSLRNANGVNLEKLMQAHVVFGPLNLYHWIVALGLHEDRHAAQIREIGQALAANERHAAGA